MNILLACITSARRILDPILDLAILIAVAVLVLDVLWGVASRFLLGEPSRWTEETAQYLLVWVVLLGAAIAFRQNEHLGFDYLVNHLDAKPRRLIGMISHAVTILFVLIVMIYGGINLVSATLMRDQVTPALQIKKGLIYLALPISGVLILVYQLEQLFIKVGVKNPTIDTDDENF